MFNTNLGYNRYATQQNRVESSEAEQQKSQRISDATKGKKKKRKPKSKGKHRRSEITIRRGSEKQGGTGYGVVNVIAPRRPNRAGAGRPTQEAGGRGPVRGLSVAFPEAKKEPEAVARQAREAREAREDAREGRTTRARDAEIQERRRDRAEGQRQFNLLQADRRAQSALDQANRQRDIAQRQAEINARAGGVAGGDDIERRIAGLEARPPVVYNPPVYNAPVYPAQPALPAQPPININVSPVITANPVINVERGRDTDPGSRRGARGRGGGRGGGSAPPTSSEDESGGGEGPSPRSRRTTQASSAEKRTSTRRTPTQPTTPAEEASLLEQAGGAVVSGLTSGAQAVISQLPPAPTSQQLGSAIRSVLQPVATIASQAITGGGGGQAPPKEVRASEDEIPQTQKTILKSIQEAGEAVARFQPSVSSFTPSDVSGTAYRDVKEKAVSKEFAREEDYSSEGEQAGQIFGEEFGAEIDPTQAGELSGGSGSGSGSDTSLLRIALRQGASSSEGEREGLLSQSDTEKKPFQRALPTQTEQAQNPLDYLEVYQQTGGDVAVDPFEEPDEPQRPVLKLPQPLSPTPSPPKKKPPPSLAQEAIASSSGSERDDATEAYLAREAKERFEAEEKEATRIAREAKVIRERERAQALDESLELEQLGELSGGELTEPEAIDTTRLELLSGKRPPKTREELKEAGSPTGPYVRQPISLKSEAIDIPTGSLPREERERAFRGSSFTSSEDISSGEELLREQRAKRGRAKPAEQSNTQKRKADLSALLRSSKRTAQAKKGKQGFKTLTNEITQMERDIGILDLQLQREISGSGGSSLGELVSEQEGYGKRGSQGGARGGGRPATKASSDKAGIQTLIRDNVAMLRGAKQIAEPQITTKNRGTYRDSLLGLVDMREVDRLMAIYDTTITLKKELRKTE